jgi:hypothetical protein
MLPVLVISALLVQDAPAQPAASPPARTAAVAPVVPAPVVPPSAAEAPAVPAPAPVVQAPAAPPLPAAAKTSMIKVDAYHETARDSTDSNIWSAFNARQNESGPMEGTWVVAASDGRKLVSLELRNDTTDRKLEGAWRSLTGDTGLTGAGFVSDLFLDGPSLEIDYGIGPAHTPSVIELRRDADGLWRGVLLDPAGHKTEVVMSQAGHAG